MKRYFSCLLIIVALPLSLQASDHIKLMPIELLNAANEMGYQQINDFYDRPFCSGPPFLYGISKSFSDFSVVFWCEKVQPKGDSKKREFVLIYGEKTKWSESYKCSVISTKTVEIRDQKDKNLGLPGYLQFWYNIDSINLKDFINISEEAEEDYMNISEGKNGPDLIIENPKLFSIMYDGSGFIIIRHDNIWYARFVH